jgi:hypothetical protein
MSSTWSLNFTPTLGIESIDISHVPSNPTYSFAPSLCSCWFQASTQNQLICITVNIRRAYYYKLTPSSSSRVQFYTERCALLELESTHTSRFKEVLGLDAPAL